VVPPFGGDEAVAPFESARVAVLPAPYEATVSYGGGTAAGPEAILRASTQVELYDEQLGLEPWRAGIWTDGLLPLRDLPAAEAVGVIERRFGELMDAGKWVVMLGGEHSITPGGVRAAAARHPGLRVVQLDAHADLRQSYGGDPHSHACAMARCLESAPVHAVGIRNYSVQEADWIRAGIPGYRILHAWEMADPRWLDAALEGLGGRPVYLTVDVDYFDPGIVPATGTPEPGGGDWWTTLRFLDRLFRSARVVACDVVELAPNPGLHHADFTVARLVYKLVGLAFRPSLTAPETA
jgi:agmatinase